MNIALWIAQVFLALPFLLAGLMKLRTPKAEMEKRMAWAEDFSQAQVRLIGTAEFLGALGLILPGLLSIAPELTAWAASGLAVIMVGATYTHLRRKEPPATTALLLLAVFVAYGRFVLSPL